MAEDFEGGFYDEAHATVAYERDEGLVQMPVGAARADGTVPCRIARVAAPLMTKVVFVVAVKKGGPPAMPQYVPNDPNLVLLGVSLGAIVPVILPLGEGHSWAITAVYRYAMRKPLTFGKDTLPLGIQPYEAGASSENDLPASIFRNMLSGLEGPPSTLGASKLIAE